MSQSDVDVAIIGGGPAGSSNALALTRGGLSVAIVERSDYSEWRPGEVLSADAANVLARLGIDVGMIISRIPNVASRAIQTAWGSSELVEKHSIFNPYGNGWNIDRNEFDAALAIEAENAGAKIFRKTRCLKSLRNNDRWDLVLQNGNTSRLSAKFLVDATGRAARMARSIGSKLIVYDDLISIIGIFEGSSDSADSDMTVESTADGWWYLVPLTDRKFLAAFMTDSDIFQKVHQSAATYWSTMIKNTRYISSIVGEIPQKVKIEMRNSRISRLDRFFGKQWIAIGDAAFSFDPLSGDGIIRAIDSGTESAELILHASNSSEGFDHYSTRLVNRFNSYLAIRRDYYSFEQRWKSSSFWSRRQQTRDFKNPV